MPMNSKKLPFSNIMYSRSSVVRLEDPLLQILFCSIQLQPYQLNMASTLSSFGVNEDALQRVQKDAENDKHPYISEKGVKPNLPIASRPTPLIWFLVCVGLYLGALLYGEKPPTLLLARNLQRSQASTPL